MDVPVPHAHDTFADDGAALRFAPRYALWRGRRGCGWRHGSTWHEYSAPRSRGRLLTMMRSG